MEVGLARSYEATLERRVGRLCALQSRNSKTIVSIPPTTPPTTAPMFTFACLAFDEEDVGVDVDVDADADADDIEGDENVVEKNSRYTGFMRWLRVCIRITHTHHHVKISSLGY